MIISTPTTNTYAPLLVRDLATFTPPTTFTNSIYTSSSCAEPTAVTLALEPTETPHISPEISTSLIDEFCGNDDGNTQNIMSCQVDSRYWILGQPGTIPICKKGPTLDKERHKTVDGCASPTDPQGGQILVSKTKGAFFMYDKQTCRDALSKVGGCKDGGGGWILVDDSQGGQANFSMSPDYHQCMIGNH